MCIHYPLAHEFIMNIHFTDATYEIRKGKFTISMDFRIVFMEESLVVYAY